VLKVTATPKFLKLAKKDMTEEALQELIDCLVLNPEVGKIIPETGGIRKLRFHTGKSNQGKRGGIRVLYYYEEGSMILLISLFKKSDKEDLDSGEKSELRKLLPQLLEEYRNE
jgi:hypothetical protein